MEIYFEFIDCCENELMYLHNQNCISNNVCFSIYYSYFMSLCNSFCSFLFKPATYFQKFIYRYHSCDLVPILDEVIPHCIFWEFMLGLQYIFLNVWSD